MNTAAGHETDITDVALARLSAVARLSGLPARYEPVELIGRGGMGVVWRARDHTLGRDIALKLVAPHLDSSEFGTRLLREARIMAQLEHPGIVGVYDAGELDDGGVWYVMRIVHGERLDVAARSMSRGDALRVIERLCDTAAFAHTHNVVHRDLKPGNIMLGPFGDVVVLDWGVARDGGGSDDDVAYSNSGSAGMTQAGTILGTPGYMAPEQTAGLRADARTDVFGIGVIMRELLTSQGKQAPRALRSIWEQAMSPEPASRYESANAMGDDVRRYLDGARVLAHRESALERAARLLQLYSTPITLILAYLAMRLFILWWRGI